MDIKDAIRTIYCIDELMLIACDRHTKGRNVHLMTNARQAYLGSVEFLRFEIELNAGAFETLNARTVEMVIMSHKLMIVLIRTAELAKQMLCR